jgi:hypothetical protein
MIDEQMVGRIHRLLVRRIHNLERINDPVYVSGSLSFVSSADHVEDFVAAVEAVQVALGG